MTLSKLKDDLIGHIVHSNVMQDYVEWHYGTGLRRSLTLFPEQPLLEIASKIRPSVPKTVPVCCSLQHRPDLKRNLKMQQQKCQ